MSKPRTVATAFEQELERCTAVIAEGLTAGTVERIAPTIEKFHQFVLTACGARVLAEIGSSEVDVFVRACLAGGSSPSVATMHNRRSTLRLLFRTARRLGLMPGDPTMDVELPPRCAKTARPLSDREVLVGRDVAQWSLLSVRFAAAWALAEATGRGGELGLVRVRDVDLGAGRVWLAGGSRVVARWGALTEWGVRVLGHRVGALNGVDSFVLHCAESASTSGRISASSAISTVLVRAGFGDAPDVRPGSVAAWAGRRCFDESRDISLVAKRLGVRSLDHAARMICWDWTR